MPQQSFGSSPHFEMHNDREYGLQRVDREHDWLENPPTQVEPFPAIVEAELQSTGLGRRVRIDRIGRLDQISQGRVAIFTDWSMPTLLVR
jgi:hypothetical protein